MDWLLYMSARAVVGLIQALPLGWVARAGRVGGRIAYSLDARHRRVAIDNLRLALGAERSPEEIRALARENFRRIGESFACAVKTASLPAEATRDLLGVRGLEKLPSARAGEAPGSVVFAVGHFGNFEVLSKASLYVPGYRFGTTYRALRQPALNRVLLDLREKSGCLLIERRGGGEELKRVMNAGGLFMGLFSDQHGGRKGVWGSFLGRECSTTPAPAILALRYKCPLHTAICYRTGLARWRVEVGDAIPIHDQGCARSVEAITADINRAFEAAVRRDPANWFWVHQRWKPRGRDPGHSTTVSGTDCLPGTDDAG